MATSQGTMPNNGRWGWYRDHEGNEFQRVSTLVKKVETDRDGLDKWFRRSVAVGLAQRDDLVLAVKAIGRPGPDGFTREQKKQLNDIAEKALEAGKTSDGGVVGTAVHQLTERLDRGEPLEQICAGLPAHMSVAVRNYAALLELNSWTVIEVERTVINDDLGIPGKSVGGSFDRIYAIPSLKEMLGLPCTCQHGHRHEELPVIGDVKTEDDPTYNGLHITPQLAIYSRARRMWLPPGQYVDAPCVRQDVGVVVHIDKETGAVRPLFVDLTTGWRLAQRAAAQAADEGVARRKLGVAGALFAEMPGIKQPRPVQSFVDHMATKEPTAARLAAAEQVAVTQPDGNVSWAPAPAAGHGALDDIDRQAIANIWEARDLGALGETWRIYTEVCGRTWGGRVAEAADARRRQIECPQRQLHVTGKCACGWVQGVAS